VTADAAADLHGLAQAFADTLDARLRRILPGDTVPTMRADLVSQRSDTRAKVVVQPSADGQQAAVPLTIDGAAVLNLAVHFYCCWDSGETFLTVDNSSFNLRLRDRDGPLFRYEYDRTLSGANAAAHLHVHAHRDEIVHLMARSARGKSGGRVKRDESPLLSAIHFPLGGHRFRPCLEDVLALIITEFGIDTTDGWDAAVCEGRAEWRRIQLGAAVRDSPETAAEALAALGWTVTPPPDGITPENINRMTAL
jgi:hypothetical protein